MIPDTSVLIKQLLARTLVGGALYYYTLDGVDMMDALKIGFVAGGVGSVISICYVENYLG